MDLSKLKLSFAKLKAEHKPIHEFAHSSSSKIPRRPYFQLTESDIARMKLLMTCTLTGRLVVPDTIALPSGGLDFRAARWEW